MTPPPSEVVSDERMSGDEAVRRVKVALAEMGYGYVRVSLGGDETDPRPDGEPQILLSPIVPDAILWAATTSTGRRQACWSCFWPNSRDDKVAAACLMGDCANLGPARPPRELLVTQGPKDAAYSVKGAR